jgi:hypothetical protein
MGHLSSEVDVCLLAQEHGSSGSCTDGDTPYPSERSYIFALFRITNLNYKKGEAQRNRPVVGYG